MTEAREYVSQLQMRAICGGMGRQRAGVMVITLQQDLTHFIASINERRF